MSVYILFIVHLINFILSGFITYFSYLAYRRTGSIPMQALMIGFGIISLGFINSGILDLLTDLSYKTNSIILGIFISLGFGFLIYAIFVDEKAVRIEIT
ncbi:MAG: hypothetical protein ABEI06_02840 [Halobacteriaceae archaeon]